MPLDYLFYKEYNAQTYRCTHFVGDVWEVLCGDNIFDLLDAQFSLKRHFTRLTEPAAPCIALLQQRGKNPHIGVFLGRTIIHLNTGGVENLLPSVVSRGFSSKIRYYSCLRN